MTRPLNLLIRALVLISYAFAAIINSNNGTLKEIQCFHDEMPCPDNPKWCIAREWLCDGQRDCLDGSDEENCFSTKQYSSLKTGIADDLVSFKSEIVVKETDEVLTCIDVSHCDVRMMSVLDEFSAFVDLEDVSVKYTRSRAFLGFCVTFEYYRDCVKQALKTNNVNNLAECIEGHAFDMMGTIYKAVCNPVVMPKMIQHITCLESAGIVDPIRICGKLSAMDEENDDPCDLLKSYSTFLACATSVEYQLAPHCKDSSASNETSLTMLYSQFDKYALHISCPTFSPQNQKTINLQSEEQTFRMRGSDLFDADESLHVNVEPEMKSLYPKCSEKRLRECSKYDLGAYIKPAVTQWLPAGNFSSVELLCNNFRYLNSCLKNKGHFGRDVVKDPRCTAGASSQTATLLLLGPFCSVSAKWNDLRWQYTKLVEYRRWPVACFRPVKDILSRAAKHAVSFETICKAAASLRGGFDCVSQWFQAQTLQAFSQTSRERDRLINEFEDATLQVMKEMTRQSLEEGCTMDY